MRMLIANRGEIACRIASTCHRMGISTVGVYSEPDRNALHVDSVDLAVALVTIAAIGVNITDRRGSEIVPPPSG